MICPWHPARYVKISLHDQGSGIPPAYLAKMFDPYFTTKAKGSGLGLATTYSIIKNHHGHITAKSKLGVGTTFTLYLPASDRTVIDNPEVKTELFRGKGKILIMDDEDLVREVIGKDDSHISDMRQTLPKTVQKL